ncbi:MAG: DNA polymerase I [Deltaproteobacteria bacterium]|nr:DNA polymerase I [Deltaproteobacteria bacterium]
MSPNTEPEGTPKPTFVLVDGSNYMYRAFYAIRELTNSKGFPTNAIYGFTTMLMKLLRDTQPDYIAMVFDVKGPTFRHESFDQYKATRKATPDTLVAQIPYIKDVVRGFAIPVLEQQGIEADDIIGALAKRFSEKGMKIVIVSGDKDLMQLISEDVVMIDSMKDKTFDVKAVKEKFGVGPDKVAEVLGLMGDTSDNIPGVPGIGPKNAQRLIEEYGSVEAVIQNVDKLRNAVAKKSIRENAEQARLSRDLATIRTDVQFDFDLESCRYTEPDRGALMALFREFEFSSLMQDLKIKEDQAGQGNYRLIRTADELAAMTARLTVADAVAVDCVLSAESPMNAEILGIALCPGRGEVFYLPMNVADDGAEAMEENKEGARTKFPLNGGDRQQKMPARSAALPGMEDLFAAAPALPESAGKQGGDDKGMALKKIFADGKITKHAHDMKNMEIALAGLGAQLMNPGCDTMVAAYVINPAKHNFNLAEVAGDYLRIQIVDAKNLIGAGAKAVPFSAVPQEQVMDYACRRADAVMGLAGVLAEAINAHGLAGLFYQVEMPLVAVLAAMEKKGVLLDLKLLSDMSKELEQLLSLSEEKIYRLAGETFNINSPKQLQVILFDKMKLPKGRKTKEGYSTDVDVLTNLAASHELPAEILAYRSLAKLKSTYVDALPTLVNSKTGRVHTSYNQTVTATGRLSSSNPNLQNIPIRTLEGKRIRQAFIAPSGWEIVSADYSQIELRVLAHLSGDKTLVAAFESGEDIHSRTASDIFGVFPAMVNAEMRRQAKVINFGVLYGMSPFGLSRELGINQKLAQIYIEEYFKKYEGVKSYLDGILDAARRDGYVTTLFNRRRYLPELNNANAVVRQFAERMAVNTPIQGTAADLIKIAMIYIDGKLKERRLRSAMIMQVHDELVFEIPSEEKDELMALIREEMEGVAALRVPLKVDCASGKNWDEAHR